MFVSFQIGKNQASNKQQIVAQTYIAPTDIAIAPILLSAKPTTEKTISLSKIQMDNWRTYRGDEYTYQYPSEWANQNGNTGNTSKV